MNNHPAPIWIIGRQHSGNTVLTAIFGRHPDVHAFLSEDTFFEQLYRFRTPPSRKDISSISELIRFAQQPPVPASVASEILERLRSESRGLHAPVATQLYASGKGQLTRQAGAQRWAQKATSYVFYADAVISTFPKSRLIYLVRNPLDIAASLAIRSGTGSWLRMCIGWRKGTRRALTLREQYPDRFVIIRYEDLVSEPRSTVRELFSFCDLGFDESVLDIRHLNPSEKPYSMSSSRRGLSTDKLFYYRNHLSPSQVRFVLDRADPRVVARLYPEFSAPPSGSLAQGLVSQCRYTAAGLLHIAGDVVNRITRDPKTTVRRFLLRLRPFSSHTQDRRA